MHSPSHTSRPEPAHPEPALRGKRRARALGLSAAAALMLSSSAALAFPGLFVGKGDERRINHVTHVVVAKSEGDTVVSVWPDYEGPLDSFAVVLPVPSDVKLSNVETLKRDVIDRLDEITAPRFHEFWEMDPCEPGEPEQEWERDLTVKGGDSGFLGTGMPDLSSGGKLPPELLLDLKPPYKEGEYSFALVPKGRSLSSYLSSKGLRLPASATSAVEKLESEGTAWLVASVDSSQVELAGAKRALLSPIRFATSGDYSVPSTLGLAHSAGKQELVLYVLHPEQRFEVANYPNAFAPTNVGVDFKVKERMGEFYGALHDALLTKNPKAFLVEYAWPTIKHCGQPCPSDPLQPKELLALGGDVFDRRLSKKELNPTPPPPTPEEAAQIAAADKQTQKRMKEQRVELAKRRALLERHRYVVTRLHHRYGPEQLTEAVALKPAGHVQGGLGEPKGPRGELPTTVESAEDSRLQTRFTFLHPSKSEEQCDNPVRHRWGKAPRTYRGLRKVWTARDMDRKNRTQFASLGEVITTDVPQLGLESEKAPEPQASTPPPAAEKACDCTVVGGKSSRLGWAGLLLTAGAYALRLRRRSR